jgi:hypothetical protein
VRRLEPDRALRETVREGRRVVEDELRHFLEGRERALFWPALKAAAVGAGWATVADYISRETGGSVNNGTVGRVLRSLRDAYLVSVESGLYRIPDPMLRTYVMASRAAP